MFLSASALLKGLPAPSPYLRVPREAALEVPSCCQQAARPARPAMGVRLMPRQDLAQRAASSPSHPALVHLAQGAMCVSSPVLERSRAETSLLPLVPARAMCWSLVVPPMKMMWLAALSKWLRAQTAVPWSW